MGCIPTEPCIHSMVIQGVVKQKTMFSSAIGHSGAHWSKLRTTFGFIIKFKNLNLFIKSKQIHFTLTYQINIVKIQEIKHRF